MADLKKYKVQENAHLKSVRIPVKFTDMSVFDGAFTYMKQRFREEMGRVEDEMNNLSKNLQLVASKAKPSANGLTFPVLLHKLDWDFITSSPLIEDEGKKKMLSLQFDVSLFEPEEVHVNFTNDTLTVSAQHEMKNENCSLFNSYNREFRLPPGIEPWDIQTMVSKDGILIVRAPLPFVLNIRTMDI